ncbi:hypothetical protein A2U01_0113088, partial [Trifolium medium]|nr:hypothetical protein [Trifolium medium]
MFTHPPPHLILYISVVDPAGIPVERPVSVPCPYG